MEDDSRARLHPQADVITLADARRLDITRWQLRNKRWRRVERGSYTAARMPPSSLLILASIRRRLPTGAAYSGLTAAWLHGLDLLPCDPVEVTIPYECRVSGRAGVVVRRGTLGADDVTRRRGLPVTTPLRTATDIGRRLPLIDAVVAVDMALHARLTELPDLERFVSSHSGEWGIARLRRVVELAEPAAESAMESRLRLLLTSNGMARPEAQVSLHDGAGRFIGRTDLFYRAQRLAIEYDGGNHRDRLVEDNRRQNRILGAGYRLLRFTASDLLGAPERLIAEVRASLSPPRH